MTTTTGHRALKGWLLSGLGILLATSPLLTPSAAWSASSPALSGASDLSEQVVRIESPAKTVIAGIRRPEVGSHTDSYIYGGGNIPFGNDVKFWITMDPNGYGSPVTMYVKKMNRNSGQTQYYNLNTGFSSTEADLFGSSGVPIRIKAPTFDNFMLFGNGSSLGAISPESTGQYQLVVELRDENGDKVVSFTNAMYNFVDAVINMQGDLGSQTWTKNNGYILGNGGTFVPDAQTLTIEAGTFVIGSQGSPTALLVVRRGGKIQAAGTNVQPILFTSENTWANRVSGDWGGLVINGAAPTNQNNPLGEGDSGPYGGTNAADSSGTLSYVRVEYGGRIFSADDELNGIAFQGVGSGTKLDNIQVINGKDDGVEFFGGTANASNLIVIDAQDDSLDWTFGWTGTATNVCLLQLYGPSERLIEGDNFEDNFDQEPRSKPTLNNILGRSNATTGPGSLAADGFRIRRGSDVVINNAAVLDVPTGERAFDFTEGSDERCNTGNCSFTGALEDGPGDLTNLDPVPAGMTSGTARIANASSRIQPDLAPLSGGKGCTTTSNDWTKDYWVSWDIGPTN